MSSSTRVGCKPSMRVGPCHLPAAQRQAKRTSVRGERSKRDGCIQKQLHDIAFPPVPTHKWRCQHDGRSRKARTILHTTVSSSFQKSKLAAVHLTPDVQLPRSSPMNSSPRWDRLGTYETFFHGKIHPFARVKMRKNMIHR